MSSTVSHEDYVRSKWISVRYDGHRILAKRPNGGEWILSGNRNYPFERSLHFSTPHAWEAAAKFTRKIEEDILGVSLSVSLLNGYIMMASQADKTILLTTLRREQAELAALKDGML